MNPSENFTERLHVMVTPTQKRLIEEAAELRGFRSEGSVIRHLVDTHLPSLIQQGGKPVDIGAAPVTPFPRPSSLIDEPERDTRVRTADPGPVKIRPSSMSRGWVERHDPDPVDQIRAAIARPAEVDEADL